MGVAASGVCCGAAPFQLGSATHSDHGTPSDVRSHVQPSHCVLILLAGGCRRGVKSVDDEPPAATAEEASDRFLKAVAGKDIRSHGRGV